LVGEGQSGKSSVIKVPHKDEAMMWLNSKAVELEAQVGGGQRSTPTTPTMFPAASLRVVAFRSTSTRSWFLVNSGDSKLGSLLALQSIVQSTGELKVNRH
jgi:hypothetical protein